MAAMLGLPSGGSGGLAVVPVKEEQGEGAHHQEEEHPHAEAGVVLDGLGAGEGLLHGAWPPRVCCAALPESGCKICRRPRGLAFPCWPVFMWRSPTNPPGAMARCHPRVETTQAGSEHESAPRLELPSRAMAGVTPVWPRINLLGGPRMRVQQASPAWM